MLGFLVMIAFTTSQIKIENEAFFILLQTKENYKINEKYNFIDQDNSEFLSIRYLKEVKEFKILQIPEYLCFLDKNIDKQTWLSIKELQYSKKPLDLNIDFKDFPIKMLIFSTRPNEKRIQTLAYVD
jgi:hypothetical protein